MNYQKPDGSIKIQSSGCCCPPGERRKGQHTNSCTTWWKAGDGPWQPVYQLSHTMVLAGAAETCAEFMEAIHTDSGNGGAE